VKQLRWQIADYGMICFWKVNINFMFVLEFIKIIT